MDDKILRKELIELLKGGQAHSTLEEVLKDLTPKLKNRRVKSPPDCMWYKG